MREFKNYYHYHSEQEFTFNDIKQRNRNPLLYLDIGADGIKTGHTEAGGYGLIASGEQLGRRVVLVVNGLPDKKARAQESARLLEWGLKGFENKTLLNSGDVVVDVPVVLGEQESVPLYIKDKVRVTLQTGKLDEIKADVTFTGPLKAPVKGDVEAGVLKITLPRGDVLEYKLYTKDSVRSLGFVASTVRKLKLRLNGEG
jgi:D-alanyl-D-alanine carboxypeptidase (penicillin-binding protein 5/6)